ncbi:helix-turn-helix transcriptional regulator [Pseudomonas sp. 21LCFQ02]|uniref:helix-turn-helix transcriptional regulator n=1 Tax=unclassified Pseudomonas TaxID=196821 RepID=UPI0004F7125C|nr:MULTISPECIES: helix-turn-helix transcriptional regulator [unclassified Pseudomonas]MCO8167226.1 helix-turn-helix transcriptional regulator [Pseudomonas sp. 21LCFQ02]MCQ9422853.1 helix-turn-helix transcriptional regulator [Pseudomonas sp. LJDD11]BAP44055.1 LuxR family transcriptional regulator [Pseudomonas sp. StFLB209]
MLDSNQLARHCLSAFTHQVPAALAAFYRIDAGLLACDFQLQGMQASMHDAYLEHYRWLDPLQPKLCAAIDQPVIALRDGLAHQDPGSSQEYRRFLQRHQVVDVVEVIAHLGGRPALGVSLLRCRGQQPFQPDELHSLLALHGLMQMAAAGLQTAPPTDRLQTLTARERQIALLLQDGASNKQLARQLDLGLPTVKTHLINLFRKVGVSSRTELVSRLFL